MSETSCNEETSFQSLTESSNSESEATTETTTNVESDQTTTEYSSTVQEEDDSETDDSGSSHLDSSTETENSSETATTSSDFFSSSSTVEKNFMGKKKIQKKICFLFTIIFLLILVINVIILIVVISIQKRKIANLNLEKFEYQMVYHDLVNNEIVEGIITEDKKVRGFHFSDEEGAGFLYPLSFDDGKFEEYKISTECSCCVECVDDEHCKGNSEALGEHCVDNICLKCEEDDHCAPGLICNRGDCIKGDCRNNEECNEQEICNFEGKCVKGCRTDDACGKNGEICLHEDGTCVKGCRIDENCKGNKKCINGECLHGCNDNFDCGGYESVCVDNECLVVDEADTCFDQSECNDGQYCHYEYMMCAKLTNRRETVSDRRELEVVIPAVCSVYGVITLFIMAASYTVVNNMAKDTLTDECYQRCSDEFTYLAKATVGGTSAKEVDISKEKTRKGKSSIQCNGQCRKHNKLLSMEWSEKAGTFCKRKKMQRIFSTTQVTDIDMAKKQFIPELSMFCSKFMFGEVFRGGKFNNPFMNVKACNQDVGTINCFNV